jgi:signal transduction histidine kinase
MHRLDVAPSQGLPQTIECTFHVTDDRILAIGHVDISGMQALQREFIELNNELNAVTRQLQKANAQLAQLNDLKNRFVGFAAHDLRKPVGVIQTYTEFLIDEARASLGQEHREFLDLIHDRARTMTRLIEELLDIAMIESGRNQADLQPADLARILRTACLSVKTVADAKRVTIHLAVDPALPALSFDALKIEQTVVNLLSNAVEHTRPETTVRVWARRAGAEVVVSVTDQGPGIPPSVKETLFQPFARGQTQKADGQDSHGLGLAIAKRMVEAHQGRIWAESASGEGATFAFALPLQRHDPIAKGQPR